MRLTMKLIMIRPDHQQVSRLARNINQLKLMRYRLLVRLTIVESYLNLNTNNGVKSFFINGRARDTRACSKPHVTCGACGNSESILLLGYPVFYLANESFRG